MKKRCAFVVVLVFGLVISAQAFADDGDEPETEFYDFDGAAIEGEFVSPELEHMEEQGEAQFDRLLNLQTSFIPKLQESTDDPAFR